MPVFKVHYYIVKPTAVPVFAGTSGTILSLTRGADPAANAQRQVVIELYERYLTRLFGASLPSGWTAQVNRVPSTGTPPAPDFSGLTIHNREPIVYWVGENTSLNPTEQTDRRPSLILIDELRRGRFQEFEQEHTRPARQFIERVSGADPGGRALAFSFAPLIAEVFSQTQMARIPFSDVSASPAGTTPVSQGWQRHQARLLANTSFHEIAHGKCEWVNRQSPGGHPWSAAISGSIHNQSGVSLLLSSVGHSSSISAGDRSLMRSHALCPMPYYRWGVAADQQCYREGSAYTPTPR